MLVDFPGSVPLLAGLCLIPRPERDDRRNRRLDVDRRSRSYPLLAEQMTVARIEDSAKGQVHGDTSTFCGQTFFSGTIVRSHPMGGPAEYGRGVDHRLSIVFYPGGSRPEAERQGIAASDSASCSRSGKSGEMRLSLSWSTRSQFGCSS